MARDDGAGDDSSVHQVSHAILRKAIKAGASELRVEPLASHCAFSCVVDDRPGPAIKLPLELHEGIARRLRSMARIDAAADGVGECRVSLGGREYGLVVSARAAAHGTAIRIRISRPGGKRETSNEETARPLPRAARASILLIEDAAVLRDYIGYILRSGGGFEVTDVGSAEEGMTVLNRRLPDLIIVDHELPGMNGTELVTRMRASERLAPLPTMLLTASDIEIEALRGGADGFIAKPVDPELLLARIEALLAARARMRGDAAPQRTGETPPPGPANVVKL